MKVVFKQTQTKHLDLQYMVNKLIQNKYKYHTFECFLYEYLEYVENFDDADSYDNWHEIRTSVYNNLYVHCCENDLDDALKVLKTLKDF